MLTITVCDDDSCFLNLLIGEIRRISFSLPENIIYEIYGFSSSRELLLFMEGHTIDIIFLDIVMPEQNGFELADHIRKKYPDTVIVFVSSYEDYVYRSFQHNPFRFLRKTKLKEELPEALQKAVEKCTSVRNSYLFHTTDGEVHLKITAILYLECHKNYFIIHCTNTDYTCRGTLTAIERRLTNYPFFRIHSSFLVNLKHVQKIDRKNSVVLTSEISLPVSQKRVGAFKEAYTRYIRMNAST